MADTKLADLTALTTTSDDDLLYVVDDPAGTPADRKLALSDVFKRGTVTTSSPVIDAAQTWNNAAVAFTGLKFNATDTASAAASLLMDLQTNTGGAPTSRFRITKSGSVTATDFTAGSVAIADSVYISSTQRLRWFASGFTGSTDLEIGRRAAANLRFGAADAAAPVAQTLSVQSVVAGTTNVAGANLTITGSQGTGTGAGGSIIFQVAPAGSSGTAQNALADALTIGGDQTSTFAGAVRALVDGSAAAPSLRLGATDVHGFYRTGGSTMGVAIAGVLSFSFSSNAPSGIGFRLLSDDLGIGFGSTPDTVLRRDDANKLALRNGANAQAFRVYNTYTSATDFERGNIFWDSNVLKIGTEKGSTGGTARNLELQVGGTTRLTITASSISTPGTFSATSYLQAGSDVYLAGGTSQALWFGGGTRSKVLSPTNGVLTIANSAATDFDRLQFGGTTSSFPALKRSSASLIVRLADDTANAALESASLKTDAPAGGTAATWKLGTVASVSPTSPNRTIEVDIGGTIYYLHAKTTND